MITKAQAKHYKSISQEFYEYMKTQDNTRQKEHPCTRRILDSVLWCTGHDRIDRFSTTPERLDKIIRTFFKENKIKGKFRAWPKGKGKP